MPTKCSEREQQNKKRKENEHLKDERASRAKKGKPLNAKKIGVRIGGGACTKETLRIYVCCCFFFFFFSGALFVSQL